MYVANVLGPKFRVADSIPRAKGNQDSCPKNGYGEHAHVGSVYRSDRRRDESAP